MRKEENTNQEEYLSKISNENPFTVPEGYFEYLPSAIQERRAVQGRGSIIATLFAYLKRPQYALTFIAVFAIALFVIKDQWGSNSAEASYDPFSASYVEQIDEDLLIEQLSAGEDAASAESPGAIEDYLIDNHIDITHLTDENI